MKILKTKLIDGGRVYYLPDGWIVVDVNNDFLIRKGEYWNTLFWAEMEGISDENDDIIDVPEDVIEFAVDLKLDAGM